MLRRSFLSTALLLPLIRISVLADTKPLTQGVRMFVVGDWGTGGKLQRRVAAGMEKTAVRDGVPNVIVSTGDNIYPSGVDSADDPQWTTKFENIYTGKSIRNVPWVAVLGNHDHRKNIMAQVEYGKRNSRWNMPAPYFSHRVSGLVGGLDETTVSLLCLDTQPALQQVKGWRGQVDWLTEELPKHKNSDWLVVVGHHPMRSYGHYGDQDFMLTHFKPLFDEHGVHAYMCGHDHDLQIIKNPDDAFHCIVSGGGGGFRETKNGKHTLASSTNGGFMQWVSDKRTATVQIMNTAGIAQHTVSFSKSAFAK